jgi:murein DD-endopeptidase MepM/ murein hydrolase activator NlpD
MTVNQMTRLIGIYIALLFIAQPSLLSQKTVEIDENFTSKVVSPAIGKVISPYGKRGYRMHTGTDIKQQKTDSIRCAFDGVVKRAAYCSGYGLLVVVQHKDSVETYYAHLRKTLVKPNDSIFAGKVVGMAGATGRATTTHLHFEIRIKGKPINAYNVFNFENDSLKTTCLQLELPKQKTTDGSMVDVTEYTVQKNDTLYAIALRYNTTVNTLCSLNNINQNSILHPGQQLKIH